MYRPPRFDEIGYWSEVKLDIVRDYATAYSRIFSAPGQSSLSHCYIDAFAGAGVHLRKGTEIMVPGSPLNALCVDPPFRELHFIDLDGDKVAYLRDVVGPRPDVHIYQGDCNDVLLQQVFPRTRYGDYRRGLCLLDPYGLHLNWEVLQTAGHMRSIDLFLNFPIMDMNRNALWHHPERVSPAEILRMNAYWGDESWRQIAYATRESLWGDMIDEKESNDRIAEAFRIRLRDVAGFANVAAPLPMRNGRGATVYYLFFASQKAVGRKIVQAIFDKYQNRGVCG